jgi:hypothetical protein
MWHNPFNQSTQFICATLAISRTALLERRNRLKQLGLISFTEGKCNLHPASYKIHTKKVCISGDTHSDTHFDTHSDTKERQRLKKKINITPLPPKGGSEKKDFDFGFVDDGFLDTFQQWVNYKKTRKQSYKSQNSLEICFRNLKKLSGGRPEIAKTIVEQSIANNWAGLFPAKGQRIEAANYRTNLQENTDYGESTIKL